MRVTGIETTKKGRYALMVDGEFAFSLHRDTFLLCPWLQKGAEVTPERLETLRQEDELRSARERALDLLSAAEQTSGTLRQKLLRWYGEEAVEAAVLRMEELGLVDDEAYARRLARDLLARKHYPRRRLAQELTGKGIDRALAEEAAAEAMEEAETDDGQQALELLRKKYYNRLYDENARRKTAAALARYGFGGDAVRRAMEAALSDQEDNGN